MFLLSAYRIGIIRWHEKSSLIKSCFIILLILLSFVEPLLATHEADHRYVLSGYVRDINGAPLAEVMVFLEHKGGEKKSIKTNNEGYYEVLFHLHNSNLGDQILVKYGENKINHRVDFDPDDKFTNRGVELDFGAPGKVNDKLWIYVAGGSLLVFVPLAYRGFSRKKKVDRKNSLRRKGKRKR